MEQTLGTDEGPAVRVDCLLGYTPGHGNFICPRPEMCESCGWNPDVMRQRTRAIVLNGLTIGPDGLARLIIQK